MFTNNITQTYNHLDASMEIMIMLLGSFLLGFLSCWIFKTLSIKASQSKKTSPNTPRKNTSNYINNSDAQASRQKTSIKSNSKQSDSTLIENIAPVIEKPFNDNTIHSSSDLRNIENTPLKDTEKSSTLNPIKNKDNLQKIKGIDPKIEKLLNKKGIYTYKQLRESDSIELKEYLCNSDTRFKNNQTATWPYQASIAAKDKWDELKVYQEFMGSIKIDNNNLAATIKHARRKNENMQTSLLLTSFSSTSNTVDFKYLQNQKRNEKASNQKNTEDDLQKLVGIDYKTKKCLNDGGIYTFKQLYKHDKNSLQKIFTNTEKKVTKSDLKTLLHQAGMAYKREWSKLKAYQKHTDEHLSKTLKSASDPSKIARPCKTKQDKISTKDDLKKIDGIGPKIENILNNANIFTFNDLKNSNKNTLKILLDEAGSQYRMHKPETWPKQAEMEDKKKRDKLQNP